MAKPTKTNFLAEVFLHEKPAKILVALKSQGSKSYASTLAKITDCTYSHTVKILDFMKKAGLVGFDKKGRIKYVKLTEIGEDIAADLDSLMRKFSKINVPEDEVRKLKKK